eukprot:673467-Amphidinium_carterae.1
MVAGNIYVKAVAEIDSNLHATPNPAMAQLTGTHQHPSSVSGRMDSPNMNYYVRQVLVSELS